MSRDTVEDTLDYGLHRMGRHLPCYGNIDVRLVAPSQDRERAAGGVVTFDTPRCGDVPNQILVGKGIQFCIGSLAE